MFSLDWPRAYGRPLATAAFKLSPEDFQVNELFDGEFSGEGEHIVLKIEKRGLSTEDVLKSLSRLINKPARLISYAGLKDRQALTTQWLSVHAPGEVIDGIESLAATGWRVLDSTRHNKKLRPGYLSGNQFVVTLRDVQHMDDLLQRLQQVTQYGVPNYFGEQRFGREGANLLRAEEMLVQGRKIKDRFLKGMYCSSARSWIYNSILARRVDMHTWNTPQPGDMMQLAGSNSIFPLENVDETIVRRVLERDVSPASPLPGKGKNRARLPLIDDVYSEWQTWVDGLHRLGLEEAWRANILHLSNVTVTHEDSVVRLSFTLPPGSYATVVLRELVLY